MTLPRLGPVAEWWSELRTLIVLSVAAQLIVAPFTAVPGDVAVWWAAAVRALGGMGLYQGLGFSYPPLFGYWCELLGGAAHLLGLSPSAYGGADPYLIGSGTAAVPFIVTTPLFTLLVKAPMIAAVLVTGYYVWRIALHLESTSLSRRRIARLAFCFWALNPLVLVETAVHGQIDALVACAVSASVLYALEGRFGLAGAAVAVGVAVKLSPVFLIPVIAGLALTHRSLRWHQLGSFVAGGLVTGAAVIGPTLGPGLVTNVFTRFGVGGAVGGLGPFGLLSLPAITPVRVWIDRRPALVGHVSDALILVVSVLAGLWVLRRSQPSVFVRACMVATGAVLLFSPLLNPQYLLWVMPFIAIGAGGALGRRVRCYRWSAALLGLAGPGYLLAYFGWAELLAPASAATGWPAALTIVAQERALPSRWGGPGWLPLTLQATLTLGTTAIALTGAGFAAAALLRGRSKDERGEATPTKGHPRAAHESYTETGTGRWRRRRELVAPASMAALIAAVEVFGLSAPALAASPMLAARLTSPARGTAVVHVVSSSPSVGVAAFEVDTTRAVHRVLFYNAPGYPDVGSTPGLVTGTLQELQTLIGRRTKVTVIGAATLRSVLLRKRSALGTLLVDVTGTLPLTAWGPGRTANLRDWLRAGGVLAFSGDVPGYYGVSAHATLQASGTAKSRIAILGPNSLLPPGVISGNVQWGMVPKGRPARWGRALGLQYLDDDLTLSLSVLRASGGTLLGLTAGAHHSSEFYVSLGRGGLLDFAGITQPGPIGHDLARLVQSDWFAHVGTFVATSSGKRQTTLRIPMVPGGSGVEVVGFPSNPELDWTFAETLRWPPRP